MGFSLVGRPLQAVLLSVLLLSLWEGQSPATWKAVAESEPQQHLTCALNETEEEAQFQGDLTHTSERQWLKDYGQHREDHRSSPAKEYQMPAENKNRNYQRVIPGSVSNRKTSRPEKQRPKVFANPKIEHALEGEDVILVCESLSRTPIDYWDWYRRHEAEGDVLLLNGTRQRVFITESASRSELLLLAVDVAEDAGQYVCVGTNSEGYHAAVVLLKVRSHLAVLWPFLGIILEVLVLFTIILLNEHSRTLAEELVED